MNKTLRRLLALVLAGLIVLIPQAAVFAEAQLAQAAKDETVYAKLNPDGSINNIYVVNSFELDEPSQFVDYGDYLEVRNLTTTDTLTVKDGAIEITAPKGRFYYQGNLESAALPWDIAISYILDDSPVSAAGLAGKSGHAVISLDVTPNDDANPVFNERYMLQISLTLDVSRCTEVEAKNATVVPAGKSQVVTFVNMPGASGHYSVSMDVANFEMDGIQVTGIPFSMGFDLPDAEELARSFSALQKAIDQLDDGATKLAGGSSELKNAYARLHQGLSDMQTGLTELTNGLSQLAQNGEGLRGGSQQVLDALTYMQSSLTSYSEAIGGIGELSQGSADVLAGLNQVAGGLDALRGSFAQADQGINQQTGGLYQGLQQANEATIASLGQQLQALQANPAANASQIQQISLLIGLLTANSQLIGGLKTGISGDGSATNPGLAAGAGNLATQYAQLDAAIQNMPTMLAEMGSGLAQLKGGVDQMVSSYVTFHGGLDQYLSAVVVVKDGLKTLSNGYGALVVGSKEFQTGLAGLNQGMKDYAAGTGQMSEGLSGMDLGSVSGLLDIYEAGDFQAVSFVSAKNERVDSVQFIMMTDGVKVEKQAEVAPPAPPAKTFWQRFLNLFGLGD